MIVRYASDLHLEFRENAGYLRDNPLKAGGDVLVLAGDIGYINDDNYSEHPFWDWAADNFNRVLVVPGNHEYYKFFDVAKLPDGFVGKIRNNVHFYNNAVVNIEGVDFILSTLWAKIELQNAFQTERGVSDFRRIMYNGICLGWNEFNELHRCAFDFIKKSVAQSRADKIVVVTHHVPSPSLMSPEFEGSPINGAFTVDLTEFIEQSRIDYWIYGHSHRNIDKTIGSTQCLCNQLGYVFHNEHLTFEPDRCIML